MKVQRNARNSCRVGRRVLVLAGLLAALVCAACSPAGPPPAGELTPTAAPVIAPGDALAPGVWKCPESTAGAAYISSLDDDTFYRLDCGSADLIAPETRICFADRQSAIDYGYKPCGRC